eukprot:CAMPEP_0173424380 /NCGR_PEP_ID=MMETSP1357-20121228/4309_1 /TAXON_ID=77926 /ORGANISM="Hemiselmis rufescens, Strain PCC563" /LENGTH=74 /DNA_ID=CAMNT_0014387595 /DNA_START=60 /DNA_END=284 /DNA_ORIENTATION=-
MTSCSLQAASKHQALRCAAASSSRGGGSARPAPRSRKGGAVHVGAGISQPVGVLVGLSPLNRGAEDRVLRLPGG